MAPAATLPDSQSSPAPSTFIKENASAAIATSSTESRPTASSDTHNPSHEEHQYLNLIRDILRSGHHRPDRTGTGTLSIPFPPQLRFSLSKPSYDPNAPSPIPVLPLLTTKRVFLRAVIAELLWFISGTTTSKPLTEAGIKIWDGNGSRAYLDSIGLSHREEGDLGPVYGFQWRHFGAEYVDAKTDYTDKGVDQIKEVIRKLRENPYDRRIILSAWNVSDLKIMALPPCHMFAQFYVEFPSAAVGVAGWQKMKTENNNPGNASPPNGHSSSTVKPILHCLLYQRSCDMGLGVPFNIASYALLTHMLAFACDMVPGTLVHTMGDAHIYLDHVEALQEQLTREPREFPELKIKREDQGQGNVDGWDVSDFEVLGYKPHGGLKMKMSV
ncbi:putative thymidylate synthase [Phaeomoniella chlamydospora]|uniref:Thymidylate synthase n=1 Tax=Phaeomoniella chlamydospora TaxID=158046 RepID=A0A0G2EYD3_PHACM|nr:putative thymidylate synthase [Phaeomoniella chlamydospora]